MIPAGTLTTDIEILAPTVKTTHLGEQQRAWDTVMYATRCGTLKRAGRRDSIEGSVAPAATRTIIMRYRPGVTIYHRVRFVQDNEVWLIENPIPDRRNGSLILELRYLEE